MRQTLVSSTAKEPVPTVSYDMLTLVIAFRSEVLMTFTCFGVVGVEWWFYDLLLTNFNFKTS